VVDVGVPTARHAAVVQELDPITFEQLSHANPGAGFSSGAFLPAVVLCGSSMTRARMTPSAPSFWRARSSRWVWRWSDSRWALAPVTPSTT
jgi:hypothetical protein